MNTFLNLINRRGVNVTYHKETDSLPCPCRTPEGYRDPEWHLNNPSSPECNNNGYLFNSVEFITRAIIIPASSGGRKARDLVQVFGEIKTDDQIGAFPLSSGSNKLDFNSFTMTGADYVVYHGHQFIVLGATLIPDPHDPSVIHHQECAMRRMT